MSGSAEAYSVDKLMSEARNLAAAYRQATGKSLAISGEIALSDAVRLLGLEPAAPADEGFDAVRRHESDETRIQVKARMVFEDARRAHRLGQLKLEKEWDAIILVLMDESYVPLEMYEATRSAVEDALAKTPQKARGSLSVAKFRHIARRIWSRD